MRGNMNKRIARKMIKRTFRESDVPRLVSFYLKKEGGYSPSHYKKLNKYLDRQFRKALKKLKPLKQYQILKKYLNVLEF